MSKVRFTGKLWPVRPKPKEGELLSSWMVRLALAHGTDAHSFWSAAWPGQYVWTRDIDIWDDREFMRMLAEKIHRPVSTFAATSLTRYQGLLYDKRVSRRRLPWVMPVGVRSAARRQYGLQFCPHCLAEDREPYYRRIWRLGIAAICLKHRVLLSDRCRRCGAAVCFHIRKRNQGQDPISHEMTRCYACGHDMREIRSYPSAYQAQRHEVDLQSLLMNVVDEGQYRMSADHTVTSYTYFKVVHRLMLMLLRGSRVESFRSVAKAYFGIEPPGTDLLPKGKTVETFDAANRLRLLGMINYLLQDWPHKYDDFCKEDKLWNPILFRNWLRVVDELRPPSVEIARCR